MGLSLTGDQLREITRGLFLTQHFPTNNRLPKPVNSTGAGDFTVKLELIGANPIFSHMGIGVVNFTDEPVVPKVWLHNGDAPWRIASTAKLGMLLAAVQLREDVRYVQQTKLLTKPEEYDELFAMPEVWAQADDMRVEELDGLDHAPRPSTIFDFKKSKDNNDAPLDFIGAPNTPDGQPNGPAIVQRLSDVRRIPVTSEALCLAWDVVTFFDFAELLWLAGARSDNLAATACISEIGVAYIKAVQRAYGLFVDGESGMRLLLAGAYGKVDTAQTVDFVSPATYRAIQDVEPQFVKDLFLDSTGYNDHMSWVGGSAAALTAYMLALKHNDFGAAGHNTTNGKVACDTIRANLSQGRPFETQSHIVEGVRKVANVTKHISKIGLLRHKDGEFYEHLNCEFAYLETTEKTGDPRPMQYGLVLTGIRITSPGIKARIPNAAVLAQVIAGLIHTNLLA